MSYANGPGNSNDWIGIYKKGQTPGSTPSTTWSYTTGTSGTRNFTISTPGEYYVTFLKEGGYTQITTPIHFWVGALPTLTSDKTVYAENETVKISYTNAPHNTQDWIGVYKMGVTPASGTYTQWKYVTSNNGSMDFTNLPKGYYYAVYHIKNGYTEISPRIKFQVGDKITNIQTNKLVYNLGEPITVSFSDGPGIEKDYLGIYKAGEVPGTDQLFTYKYFGGLSNGVTTINGTTGASGQPNQVPQQAGDYFIVMFTNDSYNEVSNRVNFKVIANNTLATNRTSLAKTSVEVFPNPMENQTTVKAHEVIKSIVVYDLNGKEVLQLHPNVKVVNLQKQTLTSGIYMLRVVTNEVHNLKLVIQ